uniref:PARP4 MVP-ID C-terminal domain-containing protein n=1 Tax=Rhinolophus ferrumequinum TaxID=59479 RepID=A0A671DQH6_RHIFE
MLVGTYCHCSYFQIIAIDPFTCPPAYGITLAPRVCLLQAVTLSCSGWGTVSTKKVVLKRMFNIILYLVKNCHLHVSDMVRDGFWKLTPELGFILKLNTNILNSFLNQKGIRSLGIKGKECLLDLIATLLVLQLLRTKLEQEGIVFKSLMKLDDAPIPRNIHWAFEKIKKASEWVRRTEGQYPSICQRLELGKDWDSATKQLLGIQPINTTSPPEFLIMVMAERNEVVF